MCSRRCVMAYQVRFHLALSEHVAWRRGRSKWHDVAIDPVADRPSHEAMSLENVLHRLGVAVAVSGNQCLVRLSRQQPLDHLLSVTHVAMRWRDRTAIDVDKRHSLLRPAMDAVEEAHRFLFCFHDEQTVPDTFVPLPSLGNVQRRD
jgi:hypothetical protein